MSITHPFYPCQLDFSIRILAEPDSQMIENEDEATENYDRDLF